MKWMSGSTKRECDRAPPRPQVNDALRELREGEAAAEAAGAGGGAPEPEEEDDDEDEVLRPPRLSFHSRTHTSL